MKSIRSRVALIVALTLGAIYYISPTLIYFSQDKDVRNDQEALDQAIPNWLPKKHIKLGLDLQGGVQLVLGVDTEVAIDNKLSRVGTEITRWANEEKKQVKEAFALKGKQTLRVVLEENVSRGEFKGDLAEEFPGLEQVERDGQQIDFKYSEAQLTRIRKAALEQAERVVRNRVDKWGVSEPSINRRADGSVLVQLPGFKDPSRARELLGRTAQLKFKMLDEEFKGFESLVNKLPEGVTFERRGNKRAIALISEDKQAIVDLTKGLVPEGRELLFEETSIAAGKKTRYTGQVLKAATELSGEDVLDANVTYDPNSLDNRPAVSLKFTAVGGKRFADVTGANVGNRMAIVLDNVIVSDPVIQGRIAGGVAQITLGSDKGRQEIQEEAQELSLILRSGALPAPITILEERQVGATLGPELANQGVTSVLVGLVLVLIFMVIYYRRPGMLSSIALVLNGVFLLALMASFGFALTLPGFAGFVLTLGMAVDANVLINERIRQELREGRVAKKAVENGFGKVFWTIIDANVTTLIAAFVLLETNSAGPIKGFSVALILGLLVSMFTSLFVTKALFEFAIDRNLSDKKIRAWLGAPKEGSQVKSSIDFLRFGKMAASIGLAVVVGVFAVGGAKGMNWSVDFAGGTELELLFDKAVDAQNIRSSLEAAGVPSPTLQEVGGQDKHYLVRFESLEGGDNLKASEAVQDIRAKLLADLKDFGPDLQRVDFVGPLIGKELRKQGILSVALAILGVLVYIGLRFDMRFGPGAVYKMLQDVFVILGFYLFFQRSFDLTSVAALLTVVGYSVNDTIVIYDRIRENLTLNPRRKLYENINISLNETLTRTINTSITTIVALIGILLFGTAQIWNFAAAMAIGVLAATLSSTFIATSFILWSEKWRKSRAAAASA
ncbi:protein translocase subunit SecD [Pseudobacteriovorax antillogorgiicola]|uniref:Multifunctional fusion protein n=1 Tax=Pseudobacteriovorax antillogorgiicola TaxID=1513793 RepID=A0A1Y6BP81_9BACT|nr:protein translocase subunit SecD [Pseudobacteriovorax antillogorgiicola]TCS53796.1 protein translocase subunit secF /protein translocase subunit secD [Pseudobacteriovorax antillogorgiicola]SMF22163.1 protein translocase subunit secF /protein translocase subunit secD [Pseudobacteriovorax antillogorgiicola]